MEPEEKMQNDVSQGSKIEVNKPVVENEKMSKKSVIGLVVLTIIALAGVAFGIWGVTEKDQAEKELAVRINEINNRASEIEKQKTVVIDEDDASTEIVDTNSGNVEDYIYVGEWGIKIKIPEGLKTVSYKFAYGAGYTKLVLWGADCSDGQCQYFPDFADADKNNSGLGAILRYPKGTELSPASQPSLVFSDDEYDYRYAHVQAVYSTDQSEIDHETKTVDLVTKMLSDPDNYSKI